MNDKQIIKSLLKTKMTNKETKVIPILKDEQVAKCQKH